METFLLGLFLVAVIVLWVHSGESVAPDPEWKYRDDPLSYREYVERNGSEY